MNDETIFAFRRNVIVAASAGTGKTFRLVSLYALLTLGITSMGRRDDREAAPPISPELIGATTFSRSAAAEIRVRVERLLGAVATATFPRDLEAYARVLARRAERTGQPAIDSDVMRERARIALSRLPHALVDTLHGLAASIIRSSAFEIGMAPNFGVVDEDEGRRELALSVDEALTAALERGDRGARNLLEAAGGLARAREQIARLLERLDEEGLSIGELEVRDATPDATALAAEVLDCVDLLARENGPLGAAAANASRELRRFALDGIPWFPANDIRDAEPDEAALGGASRALADTLWPLIADRSSPKDPAPLQALRAWFNDSIKASAPTKRDKVERFAELMVHAPGLRTRTLAARGVLEDAVKRLEQKRRHAGRLGFGDMLRIARDAVRDDPRVAARARESFPVLLVDEFQDTSRVQRDLVYLLRERDDRARVRTAGTLPGPHDLKTHGLLLVGDRKQSIYGFRGADVTVFSRVCAELAGEQARRALGVTIDEVARGTDGREIADLVPLAENRRSAPEILAFVNQFASRDFGGPEGKKSYDLVYAEAEHLRPPAPDPAVEGARAVPSAAVPASRRVLVVHDEETRAHPLSPPELRFAKGELREAFIAALVVERMTRGQVDAEPALSFGELAVLTRRRQFLPLLEYALDRLKLPFILAGRALFATREAHDLSAVLRMLVDRSDRHALATVLRGPAFAISDTTLLLLSEPGRGLLQPHRWFLEGEGGAIAPAERVPLHDREALAAIVERIAEVRRVSARLGAADALRYAVRELEIDSVLAALPRGAQRLGNIDRIVSMASDQGGSLSAFSRWLDAKIADETDETEATVTDDGDDAVRLLTIHASKGLEFRAVIAVDLAWTPRTVPHAIAMTRVGARPGLMVRPRTFEGAPLFLPEYAAHLADEKGRDIAERKRLTYVALTRARELLVLVRPDRDDPARGSALETLRALPEDGERSLEGEKVLVGGGTVISMNRWLDGRAAAEPAARVEAEPDRGPTAGFAAPAANRRARTLTVATTPLATFAMCPRRYELLHVLEIDEPPPGGGIRRGTAQIAAKGPFDPRPSPGDPRDLGTTAHAWLERFPLASWGEPMTTERITSELRALAKGAADTELERAARGIGRFLGGAYARRVAAEGAVARELVFVMPLEGGVTAGSARTTAPRCVLRGAIDLLVRWPDGSADVIDYKLTSHKDVAPYAFQLRTYALAAVRRLGAQRVRAGIVFLDGDAGVDEPVFLEPAPHVLALAAFEAELGELGTRLAEARWADRFDGVTVERCRRYQCGFLTSCHPPRG
jgi:ATP-dependent helicase/nuclease subunit A